MVIAKQPVPGKVKTRLCPPLSPGQAAEVARASLDDTIAALAATPAHRRIAVFEGDPAGVVPDGFDVVPQVQGGLGERLAAAFTGAFAVTDGPALIVGMDTPQVTPVLLCDAAAALDTHDAVLGPADDGGYWIIGFRSPRPGAFDGVPMSRDDTGEHQLKRLAELGLSVAELPQLRDVDTADDLAPVAAAAPATRFAALVNELLGTGTVS